MRSFFGFVLSILKDPDFWTGASISVVAVGCILLAAFLSGVLPLSESEPQAGELAPRTTLRVVTLDVEGYGRCTFAVAEGVEVKGIALLGCEP